MAPLSKAQAREGAEEPRGGPGAGSPKSSLQIAYRPPEKISLRVFRGFGYLVDICELIVATDFRLEEALKRKEAIEGHGP